MFQTSRRQNPAAVLFSMLELTFNWTVRNLSTSDRNPGISLIKGVIRSAMMLVIFFGMFTVLGMRGSAVRGDFIMYLLSGIMPFMVHNQTMGQISGAIGPNDPMMKHAPLNRIVVIASAALGSLYIQFLSTALILFVYHAITGNVQIHNFIGALAMFLLAWFSGVCVGVAFLGLRQHFPAVMTMATTMYRRANMVFSGKMFLANSLPSSMLSMFDWNPLFHNIDQMRGFVFLNYNPHFSSISYPIKVCLILLVAGLIFEFGKTGTGAVTRAAGN